MRKLITEDKGRESIIYYSVIGADGKKQYDFYMHSRYSLYLIKVNLESREYLYPGDLGYDESEWQTIEKLLVVGRIRECVPYRMYDVEPKLFRTRTAAMQTTQTGELLKRLHVDKIIKEFKDNGFNVSRAAIVHNFEAWLSDLKSGYKGRGYHLFTPCGCNPLLFHASELYPACRDWQKTYEC